MIKFEAKPNYGQYMILVSTAKRYIPSQVQMLISKLKQRYASETLCAEQSFKGYYLLTLECRYSGEEYVVPVLKDIASIVVPMGGYVAAVGYFFADGYMEKFYADNCASEGEFSLWNIRLVEDRERELAVTALKGAVAEAKTLISTYDKAFHDWIVRIKSPFYSLKREAKVDLKSHKWEKMFYCGETEESFYSDGENHIYAIEGIFQNRNICYSPVEEFFICSENRLSQMLVKGDICFALSKNEWAFCGPQGETPEEKAKRERRDEMLISKTFLK